jgi:site-specific recombinase XerD
MADTLFVVGRWHPYFTFDNAPYQRLPVQKPMMPQSLTPPSNAKSQERALTYRVLDTLGSDHSRRAYHQALDDFWDWRKGAALTRALVQRYKTDLQARGLSASTINQRLAAVRKLARVAAEDGIIDELAAERIADGQGVKSSGVRTGNWLTQQQAQQLLSLPDTSTLKGLRDRALLALLLGTGLRRSEAAALTFKHLAQRDGRWVVLDLVGKGQRTRTIPLPAWAKAALDAWARPAALAAGAVFRRVGKSDRVTGEAISGQTVHDIVAGYGQILGVDLAPHDLRRTFSKLARAGGGQLEQIQLSLGHASIQTTERYLGAQQDLADAPGDRLGLHL